jgi:methyltransferase (TIGR00027 family)
MIANTPSRTALGVAMRRAAHQVLDTPRVLDDPLALAIIGADRNPDMKTRMLGREDSVVARHMRAFMAVRSHVAEDELEAAIARGVRQYVVLGAGLDTFAYRQPSSAEGLSIFEIDHPDTQAWKLEKLREAQVAVPANVTHVAADLSRRTLRETLADAGIGAGQPAFFAWLGVSMYLQRDAVMATLADIGRQRAAAEAWSSTTSPIRRASRARTASCSTATRKPSGSLASHGCRSSRATRSRTSFARSDLLR